MADKQPKPGTDEEAPPGQGERGLGPTEGKERVSNQENEDERIAGPELPSDFSSEEERPVHSRDPRFDPEAGGDEEASNLPAREQKEEK